MIKTASSLLANAIDRKFEERERKKEGVLIGCNGYVTSKARILLLLRKFLTLFLELKERKVNQYNNTSHISITNWTAN